MITRRDILKSGLAALVAPYICRSDPDKSMLGARGIESINEESSIDYTDGYTNLIEGWTPTGTGNQIIQLSSSLVPLSDFTIDGCMTYHGIETGDTYVLSLNSQNPSATFSLWYRGGNVVPRCYASEGSSNPVAIGVYENPTFCFSIRFNITNSTIIFSSGDLSRTHMFSTSNWTWNTAYSQISSGLTSLGMSRLRLSNINSLRVYPFVIDDEGLMYNHAIDMERFSPQ